MPASPTTAIERAFVGYCYGDSTSGQRALYELGLTGIPVVNVNNNCSTGSSALYLARESIRGGLADCAIALGFEKMERGSLQAKYTDRAAPTGRHRDAMEALYPVTDAPGAPQQFGNAGREHMKLFGSTPEHFAWIGYKNHKHSVNNPYAQFQTEYTLDEVKDVARDLRPADAAAVLADVGRLGLRDRGVGAVRRRAWAVGAGHRDRRAGDGHRLPVKL